MKKFLVVSLTAVVLIGVLLLYVISITTSKPNTAVFQETKNTDTFIVEELPSVTTSTSETQSLSSPEIDLPEQNEQQANNTEVKQSDTVVLTEPARPTEVKSVSAELENARKLGRNASIKLSLGNFRSQAVLSYFNNDFTYAVVCNDPMGRLLLESAQKLLTGSDVGVVINGIPNKDSVTCLSDEDWYVAQSPLISVEDDESLFWCVDSTDFAGAVSIPLSTNSQKCSGAVMQVES